MSSRSLPYILETKAFAVEALSKVLFWLASKVASGAALVRECGALLLQAGASLDAIFQCREEDPQFSAEQFVDDWITFKKVSDFVATKELIRDFRAAGSWRAYTKGLRKQVLGLRSLALRDRAGTRDEVMKFIVKSPNEIAWKILSYWPTELDV